MITREKEAVVRRVEDQLVRDEENCTVKAKYPWTEEVYKLTDNLRQAIKVQSSVERRLRKDEKMLEAYNDEFRKFIDRGAISRILQPELDEYTGPISYVTHLPVYKPDSTTTPIRLVTNSSFVNENAKLSPNNCMQEAPIALSSLLEVLIGFRMNEIALVYDLSKAYQSISTGELERHVRRIVWRWGKNEADWEIYGYNVVTFGDQAAGLVLELVKGLAADLGHEIDPEASKQIRDHTYVDDGAGGGSREQVDRFKGELVNGQYTGTIARILKLVNLKLKVMVSSGDDDEESLKLLGDKTLGHIWRPKEDVLVFKVIVNLTPTKFRKRSQFVVEDLCEKDIPRLPQIHLTKRALLGFVNSQYDPMGLICPLLIILKINLRDLFGPNTEHGWDDPIPQEERAKWLEIISMFLKVGDIIIRRAVRPSGVEETPELIGFADGSLVAYSCAIYVRWKELKRSVSDPDRYHVRLVCGKARVTSARGTTAPRSEMSGFLILTRLLKVVVDAMEVKPVRITTAVDSQCTISAMEKSGGLLAPYFASRVAESTSNLSELAENFQLDPVQHVPGTQNPADIPTRATTKPYEIGDNSLWQNGPPYLALPREQWPFSRDFWNLLPDAELRAPRAAFGAAILEPWSSPLGPRLTSIVKLVMERSNCLTKTTHVTARLLKCYLGFASEKIREPLAVEDITVAKKIQLIVSMELTFTELVKGNLESLRPIVEQGIVYARTRCDGSLLKLLGVERLPILARQTRLSKLIMWSAHFEDHRALATDVLARSRRQAWIIRGRHLAKEVCKLCPYCKLKRHKLAQQLMSDIPEHQLQPCPPFSFVSLDFAGPYQVKAMGNSRTTLKVWALVIICQNTRAIKVYATAGYSTDEFFTAYTRFTSNHGNPLLVVTDSGSQLVKAKKIAEA